jgi:hypothetical protein
MFNGASVLPERTKGDPRIQLGSKRELRYGPRIIGMKATLLTILFLAACGTNYQPPVDTASGVRIIAEAGINVTRSDEAAIEQGISDTLRKGMCHGYTQNLALPGYTVELVQGQLSSEGIPAIRIPCDSYCGTKWDLGGYLLIAGQMVGPQTIRLPYVSNHESHLRLAASYEVEHAVLAANDRAEYERTKVHTGESGHPIIGACN